MADYFDRLAARAAGPSRAVRPPHRSLFDPAAPVVAAPVGLRPAADGEAPGVGQPISGPDAATSAPSRRWAWPAAGTAGAGQAFSGGPAPAAPGTAGPAQRWTGPTGDEGPPSGTVHARVPLPPRAAAAAGAEAVPPASTDTAAGSPGPAPAAAGQAADARAAGSLRPARSWTGEAGPGQPPPADRARPAAGSAGTGPGGGTGDLHPLGDTTFELAPGRSAQAPPSPPDGHRVGGVTGPPVVGPTAGAVERIETVVRVSIGRVEVHGVDTGTPPERPRPRPERPGPRITLDALLERSAERRHR